MPRRGRYATSAAREAERNEPDRGAAGRGATAAGTPTFGGVAERLLEAKGEGNPQRAILTNGARRCARATTRLWSQPGRQSTPPSAPDLDRFGTRSGTLRAACAGDRGRSRRRRPQGHGTGRIPARWRGHLNTFCRSRPNSRKGHHAAMADDAVSRFLERLRNDRLDRARALEFANLTAARTNECSALLARSQPHAPVWTIPAERMKAKREHIVPLAGRAPEIVEELAKARTCDAVFPSPQRPKRLSHIVMQRALARNCGERSDRARVPFDLPRSGRRRNALCARDCRGGARACRRDEADRLCPGSALERRRS